MELTAEKLKELDRWSRDPATQKRVREALATATKIAQAFKDSMRVDPRLFHEPITI